MDPAPQNGTRPDLDGLPLRSALQRAAAAHWGGTLQVIGGGGQLGAVYLHGGDVAWAVSSTQTVEFGHYLERIGLVPRQRFTEVVQRYRARGEAMSFGTMMAEAGLASPARLRTCLRAHIRSALASLLREPQPTVRTGEEELRVDPRWTFLLEEVLPATAEAEQRSDAYISTTIGDDSGIAELLAGLAPLPGYAYSFVIDPAGELVAVHTADDLPVPDDTIRAAVAWLTETEAAAATLMPGKTGLLLMEHGTGSLLARWTGDDRRHAVAVAFSAAGRLGVVKHKLDDLIPRMSRLVGTDTSTTER